MPPASKPAAAEKPVRKPYKTVQTQIFDHLAASFRRSNVRAPRGFDLFKSRPHQAQCLQIMKGWLQGILQPRLPAQPDPDQVREVAPVLHKMIGMLADQMKNGPVIKKGSQPHKLVIPKRKVRRARPSPTGS